MPFVRFVLVSMLALALFLALAEKVYDFDTALLLAMAHEILARGAEDKKFLATHCVGWDKLRAYILGESDGVAKTPEWAAPITTIPAETIRALTTEIAQQPAMLTATWSLQRADYGEQPYWMLTALAAMKIMARALARFGDRAEQAGQRRGLTHRAGLEAEERVHPARMGEGRLARGRRLREQRRPGVGIDVREVGGDPGGVAAHRRRIGEEEERPGGQRGIQKVHARPAEDLLREDDAEGGAQDDHPERQDQSAPIVEEQDI